MTITRRKLLTDGAALAATTILAGPSAMAQPAQQNEGIRNGSRFKYDSVEAVARHALISYRAFRIDEAEKRSGAIREMISCGKFGTKCHYAYIWVRYYTELAYGMRQITPQAYSTDDLYDAIMAENDKANRDHLPEDDRKRRYAWRVLEYQISREVDHYHALWLERGEELGT